MCWYVCVCVCVCVCVSWLVWWPPVGRECSCGPLLGICSRAALRRAQRTISPTHTPTYLTNQMCMRKNAPYTFVPDIIFFTKRIIKIRHHIDNLGQNMFQFIKSYTNEFFLTSIESLYSILSLKTRNIFF